MVAGLGLIYTQQQLYSFILQLHVEVPSKQLCEYLIKFEGGSWETIDKFLGQKDLSNLDEQGNKL